MKITLANPADAYKFTVDTPIEFNPRTGGWRRVGRLRALGRRVKAAVLWPFRPVHVVEKLAHNEGTITVAARPSPLRRLIARVRRALKE